MCRRILGLKDNQLYTFSQVGVLLNDYFEKNGLKVKNKHYELHKFKDICMAEGLGPGKHKGLELYPIAQKEIDRVRTGQPGIKVKKPSVTPIEELAEKTAKEFKKAEAVKTITKEEVEPHMVKAEEPKTEPTDFEGIRKKFYTDFHFFTKNAQTPEERTAIINALGSLYGNIGGSHE